jgi:transposase, IS30 family
MKHKHLTLDERLEIQTLLKGDSTLIEISHLLYKSPRTISREIFTHLKVKTNDRHLHTNQAKTNCQKHLRFPFVCDRCERRRGCLSDFHYYDAKLADKEYRTLLSYARTGLNLTNAELAVIELAVAHGVSKGQSPDHIKAINPDLPCSVRSLYRHIGNGVLKTGPYHLRNKVKMKKRKVRKPDQTRDTARFKGRLFEDYLDFILTHRGVLTVEMDTVMGKLTDQKCILTFIITEFHFFYAILLDGKCAIDVTNAINRLYDSLPPKVYTLLFGVLLGDRGSEFSDPESIERVPGGKQRRSHIFYCDPLASYQKGQIESIHRTLRYILPKGRSLDFMTQDKLNLALSHINGMMLKSNQHHTGYELMHRFVGEDILKKLGVSFVHPDSIHLTPNLVK